LNFEEEEDYRIRFLSYLNGAKELEEEAIERYERQIEILNDPDLVAYLEGVLRTELTHREKIEMEISRLEKELEDE